MTCKDYGKYSINYNIDSISVDDVIKSIRTQVEKDLISNSILVGELNVFLSKTETGNGGHRYWFLCPKCNIRVAKLYSNNLVTSCRHCVNLKYSDSRYKNMIGSKFGDL